MHLTLGTIVEAIIWSGFAVFFVRRRRSRQPISRRGWFGLIILFLVLGAVVSQSQYMFLDEPLVDAAQEGDLAAAQSCLADGADANALGDDGRGTALVAAASAGHTDIAALLIRNGANVNLKSDNFFAHLDKATPLQAASAYPEIIKLLKKASAK
jgi:ankyrin repeat protein